MRRKPGTSASHLSYFHFLKFDYKFSWHLFIMVTESLWRAGWSQRAAWRMSPCHACWWNPEKLYCPSLEGKTWHPWKGKFVDQARARCIPLFLWFSNPSFMIGPQYYSKLSYSKLLCHIVTPISWFRRVPANIHTRWNYVHRCTA